MPLGLISCALAAASSPSFARTADPVDLIISNITVIDPERRTVRQGQDILIEDGRIIAVQKHSKTPRSATTTINGSGQYAIPGLMDMHVHTNVKPIHKSTLALLFAHGVTGVRDMASDCASDKGIAMCIGAMRDSAAAIEAGTITGPRLLALSTMKIQSEGGPKDATDPRARFFPKNAEQTAAMLTILMERKPDLIKMGDVIDLDSYKLALATARAHKIEVSGHLPVTLSVKEAADMGQRTIEHARDLPLDCSTYGRQYRAAAKQWLASREGTTPSSFDRAKNSVATQDAKICAEQIKAMVRRGTYYVPTHLTREMDYRAADPAYRNDPRMVYIPAQLQQMWLRDLEKYTKNSADQAATYGEFYRLGLRLTGQAHKAGVRIMAGTDANDTMIFPGSSLHDELKLLAQAGLSPMDVLRAATTIPAEYLHRTADLGGLSKGKLADIVLLTASPLDNVASSQTITTVIQNGRVSDRAALDKMLQDVKEANAAAAAAGSTTP